MRLELTSLDDPASVKSRCRAALRQLKEERRRAVSMFTREAEGAVRTAKHDLEMVTGSSNGAAFWAGGGPQFQVGSFNGYGATIAALDNCIELLEEVIKPRRQE